VYKEKILEDCAKIDTQKKGMVKIPELIAILNNYVAKIPYEEIKDRLCEIDTGLNQAHYSTIFDSLTINTKFTANVPESISENFKMLTSIFHMIDHQHKGFISPEEFKSACSKIFSHLGTKFTEDEITEFIKTIDTDKDNKISLKEFGNAFLISCTN